MEAPLKTFERLYDTYNDAIFRHLYLRLGNRERALELTQDVFMRTWRYLADGNILEHPKPFLYRAAHNAFVNEIRTDKTTRSLDQMMEGFGYDVPDYTTDPNLQSEQRELLVHLEQLKRNHREVLILRYIDGLSIVAIAELLNEKETTISMRLKRALDALRTSYTHNI